MDMEGLDAVFIGWNITTRLGATGDHRNDLTPNIIPIIVPRNMYFNININENNPNDMKHMHSTGLFEMTTLNGMHTYNTSNSLYPVAYHLPGTPARVFIISQLYKLPNFRNISWYNVLHRNHMLPGNINSISLLDENMVKLNLGFFSHGTQEFQQYITDNNIPIPRNEEDQNNVVVHWFHNSATPEIQETVRRIEREYPGLFAPVIFEPQPEVDLQEVDLPELVTADRIGGGSSLKKSSKRKHKRQKKTRKYRKY